MTKYLIEEYWKRENRLINYFIFHLFVKIVADYNESTRKEWNQMPYYNNVDPLVMISLLFKHFNPSKFDRLCKLSFAHKMTYKFFNFVDADMSDSDTYYSHIMNL